ncbi:MAG: hypothetical protein ABI205_12185 [Gemmatimonadaceae bacterium]
MTRLFRTPKGLLILTLVGLAALGACVEGVRPVVANVCAAAVAALLVDAPIVRFRDGAWSFPDGALLTALIVAMVLSTQEPAYVVGMTAAVGVWSKHILRSGAANIFNPAALGLLSTFYVFHTGQSWWGALGNLPSPAIAALLAAGLFITDRVKKYPAVLSFLVVYYLLATTAAFVGEPPRVAELFRTPDVNAALYFALFMLTDPPTSPPKSRDQPAFGAIAAIIAFAAFELIGAADFLLVGLLAANAWEAFRRSRIARGRLRRATHPPNHLSVVAQERHEPFSLPTGGDFA